MNTKKLEYVNEILIVQMNHWVLYPVALTVIGLAAGFIGQGRPFVLMWGVCGLFPLLYLLIREKIKHFFPFLLLHLGVALLFLALPVQTVVERLLCAVCGVGYLIDSMAKHFREGSSATSPAPPAVTVAVCVLTLLFQHYQGQATWDFYYVLTLVSVFCLHSVTSYISHYLEFLQVNESSTGYLPAADMFHSGMGLVGIYTVVVAGVLLVATNFGLAESIWSVLRKGLIAFLRFLFSLLAREPVPEEEIVFEELQPSTADTPMGLPEGGEPFWLWQILEVAAIAAAFGGLLYALAKGIIRLIRFVRARFALNLGRRGHQVEGEEELDVREKVGLEKSGEGERQKSFLFDFLTPAKRVRKLYKKKVLASAGDLAGEKGKGAVSAESLQLLTARECGEKLKAVEMADIYEQVRYSDYEATQETLRRMREACRSRG